MADKSPGRGGAVRAAGDIGKGCWSRVGRVFEIEWFVWGGETMFWYGMRCWVTEKASLILDIQKGGSRWGADRFTFTEHGIQPVDLTKLAKVLNIGPQFTRLSRDLFTAASELKDPSATLLISRTALQHGRPMPRTVLQHLEDMVKEKNHAAMYWQGQLHEAENQDSLALQMYMEAISSAAEGSKGAEAFQIRLGEAWTGVYRMKIERDKEGAHAAIKKAAFEYDEPFAYYFLAKDFTPRTSEEYVTYMQKAAMSGKGKAADALGQHYLEQYQGTQLYSSEKSLNDLIDKLEQEASARKSPSSSTASETPPKAPNKDQAALAMAREWFQLGAEALRIHSSMIYFALILRHQGQADQGLKKLQTFTCRGNMLEVFAFFEKHWNSNSVDLLQIDVEALGSVLRDRSLAKKKSSPTVCKRPGWSEKFGRISIIHV